MIVREPNGEPKLLVILSLELSMDARAVMADNWPATLLAALLEGRRYHEASAYCPE